MADKTHKTRFEMTATDRATPVFKKVDEGLATVAGRWLGLTTLLAGGGLAAAALDATKYRAALDDLADTTGDNVRTLDGMLRVYRVAQGEIEGFSPIVAKFARNLNAADDEAKAAAQAIEALGLNVAEIRAMKPGDAMVEIAKAMATFEDGMGKVGVATALFGREGAKALPFLKDLAEAGELHGKVTAEQAAQAERLEKEIRRVMQAMRDWRDDMAGGLIPQIADWIEANREAVRIAGSFGKALDLFVFDLDAMTTEKPREAINRLRKEIEDLQKAANPGTGEWEFEVSMAHLAARIPDLDKKIEFLKFLERQEALRGRTGQDFWDARDIRARMKPALDFSPQTPDKGKLTPYQAELLRLQQQTAKEQMGDSEFIQTRLEILAGKFGVLTEAEKQNLLTMAARRDVQRSLREQTTEYTKGVEESARAVNEYNARMTALAESYLDLTSASRPLIREEEQLLLLMRQGFLTADQYNEVMIRRAEIAREKIIAVSKEVETTRDVANQVGLSFASSMDQIVFASDRAVRGLDVLKAALLDVLKILYGKYVTGPLAGGIEQMLLRAFTTPSYPDASSIAGPYGGFDSDSFANVDFAGSFATGGSFTVRGSGGTDSRLVAFRATPGERVDVSTPGSVRGSTFVIDARGADRAGIARLEQMILALDGQIEHRAVAATFAKMTRGARP